MRPIASFTGPSQHTITLWELLIPPSAPSGAFMTPRLFTPIEIGGLAFRNRIAVAPMCQYSADDGSATDWHMRHWMSLAMSGAGMVTIEATAVERRGRITHGCLGLYSDDNEAAAHRTLSAARRVAPPARASASSSPMPAARPRTGVPGPAAGRSGRRGSLADGGPSAIPFDHGWNVPTALDEAGIAKLVENFVGRGKTGGARRIRFRRDPRRARLPDP